MLQSFRGTRLFAAAALGGAALLGAMACGDDGLPSQPTTGTPSNALGRLSVQLTDAPFPFDSVKSVEVYVVRVDARQAETDSATAAANTADSDKDSGGWTTIAEPKAKIDLLTLQNGKTMTLGDKALPAGSYQSLRLIIDPAQSVVTLKGGATVDVQWPSAARTGIKVQLPQTGLAVSKDSTKTAVVDFDVSESFVMRGNSMKNGLLFKPVLRGSSK